VNEKPRHGTKRPQHLAFIRKLPCVVCGFTPSEAAHIRFNDHATGKMQAVGQKPGDEWSTPLCASHHREGPGAQHTMGERAFWERNGIDPLKLAELLFSVTGDFERGENIARQARRLAPWTN
jgi:hypothetical protein